MTRAGDLLINRTENGAVCLSAEHISFLLDVAEARAMADALLLAAIDPAMPVRLCCVPVGEHMTTWGEFIEPNRESMDDAEFARLAHALLAGAPAVLPQPGEWDYIEPV